MSDQVSFDRRHAMALAAAALSEAALSARASAQSRTKGAAGPVSPAGPGRRYFTTAEFALVDELSESLIPADEVSGGARAAQVAEFLDRQLGESLDVELRRGFKDDLAEIDRVSVAMHGRGFVRATPAQRIQVMERISRAEQKPSQPAEHAFSTLKWLVTYAYYKSKIGIHDDLQYQGNVLLDEFLGVDVGKG